MRRSVVVALTLAPLVVLVGLGFPGHAPKDAPNVIGISPESAAHKLEAAGFHVSISHDSNCQPGVGQVSDAELVSAENASWGLFGLPIPLTRRSIGLETCGGPMVGVGT